MPQYDDAQTTEINQMLDLQANSDAGAPFTKTQQQQLDQLKSKFDCEELDYYDIKDKIAKNDPKFLFDPAIMPPPPKAPPSLAAIPDETPPTAAKPKPAVAQPVAPAKPQTASIQSHDSSVMEAIRQAYDKKYKQKDGSYSEGHAEPKDEGYGVKLQFNSKKDLVDFVQEQAKAGHKFSVLDGNTGKVLYTSDGKNLYHGDGKSKQIVDANNPDGKTIAPPKPTGLEQQPNSSNADEPPSPTAAV